MANITFNTRIQNKIDTYENYDAVKDRFIPLKGEVCIATVSTKVDGVQSTPQTLIKIGDGTSTWGSLKWLSATAADVIASLKGSNPTLPAASITGLNEYISGQIQDTNTLYRLVASGDMGIQLQSKEKGEEDTAFKNVGSPIVLTAPTYSLIPGDTNGTVKFGITGSEAEVKVHGLGSAAYTESSAYAPAGAGVPSTDGVPTDYLLSPAGWVAPPSGGGENWELIIDHVAPETVASVLIDQDLNGEPFALKKWALLTIWLPDENISTNDRSKVGFVPEAYWGGNACLYETYSAPKNTEIVAPTLAFCSFTNGMMKVDDFYHPVNKGNMGYTLTRQVDDGNHGPSFNIDSASLELKRDGMDTYATCVKIVGFSSATVRKGSVIRLWGVRA